MKVPATFSHVSSEYVHSQGLPLKDDHKYRLDQLSPHGTHIFANLEDNPQKSKFEHFILTMINEHTSRFTVERSSHIVNNIRYLFGNIKIGNLYSLQW